MFLVWSVNIGGSVLKGEEVGQQRNNNNNKLVCLVLLHEVKHEGFMFLGSN